MKLLFEFFFNSLSSLSFILILYLFDAMPLIDLGDKFIYSLGQT